MAKGAGQAEEIWDDVENRAPPAITSDHELA